MNRNINALAGFLGAALGAILMEYMRLTIGKRILIYSWGESALWVIFVITIGFIAWMASKVAGR